MEIVSSKKRYDVNMHLTFNFFDDIKRVENSFYIIDRTVYGLYKDLLFSDIQEDKVYIVYAIEENKTINTALDICEKLTDLKSKRNTVIISIGGGIVQDITGFVSDILYRGIKWVFIPTTLLAACDSCIGGKTSLNYKKFKNLLGTFNPPDTIHIAPLFFETLSDSDFKSGLGEVVKFNVMYGIGGIKCLEKDIDALLKKDFETIIRYVESSLEFKKKFVEEDEFDKGERIKLNFGHTFGHAIESATEYKIPHGTAVAMGTVVANHISLCRNRLSENIFNRINDLIVRIVDPGYAGEEYNCDGILLAIRKDKKQIDDGIRAVLMYEDGVLDIVNDVAKEEVFAGFDFMRDFLFGIKKQKEKG